MVHPILLSSTGRNADGHHHQRRLRRTASAYASTSHSSYIYLPPSLLILFSTAPPPSPALLLSDCPTLTYLPRPPLSNFPPPILPVFNTVCAKNRWMAVVHNHALTRWIEFGTAVAQALDLTSVDLKTERRRGVLAGHIYSFCTSQDQPPPSPLPNPTAHRPAIIIDRCHAPVCNQHRWLKLLRIPTLLAYGARNCQNGLYGLREFEGKTRTDSRGAMAHRLLYILPQ